MTASIYTPGERPVLELPRNISFVLNVSRIVGGHDGTLELVHGHEIRRATSVEIAAIRNVLDSFMTPSKSWTPWEGGRKIVGSDGGWTHARLPTKRWRYFVITFEGTNKSILEIEEALSILPQELKIGFTILTEVLPGKKAPVVIYQAGRLFAEVAAIQSNKLAFFPMNLRVARQVRNLYQQIKDHDHKRVDIERFIQELLELDALPWDSQLAFLGYFAILEALLTHQPKPTDTIDSITRQVKRKLILLDNRWNPRLDYSSFQGSTPEKIWSSMYSYRSCIAHGSEPDFKSELQLLRNHGLALLLLKQAVRSTLRMAMAEPQLVADLRNC